MESLIIKGGNSLKGQVRVSGAKNAILPIMAASLLSAGEVVLSGVPDLEDIKVMSDALTILGARITRETDSLVIDGRNIRSCEVPENISRKMRASNLVMGALLARFGFAKVAHSGGCAIGSRPVDLHLKGFNNLGYRVCEKGGFMVGEGKPKSGREILLDFPSVGATENLIMAASTIPGTSIIRNAAREPEIIDLQNFLNRMGAKIRGAGLDTIRIEGVKKFGGINHVVIPDRIEAGTFMIAAAITRGDVSIENVASEHIQPLAAKLREMGVDIMSTNTGLRVIGSRCLRPADFKTMPYPGFPTDMQPQTMALLSTIKGTSIVVETIFENRYMHVPELRRMGAEIKIEGRVAIIKGKEHLEGASVEASDLRAGAALILAGLFAHGETEIANLRHIDRGYENIHLKLSSIGADIRRRLQS
ncbi:udp-n-acetylglucosamine 1-carboxyvinyltransferase [hydrocarbon metagenome]|uniref:UDP-N-acetylglucosamine 1-carboxyvinyltransferase n=1 Tax=hydrocarbon metagenome TaxID=938273 RepID=A0A0W8E555_9ZZZZ